MPPMQLLLQLVDDEIGSFQAIAAGGVAASYVFTEYSQSWMTMPAMFCGGDNASPMLPELYRALRNACQDLATPVYI